MQTIRVLFASLCLFGFVTSPVLAQCDKIEDQVLTASDSNQSEEFGSRIAMEGDVAVVGAVFDDEVGLNSGGAYVFRRTGGVWAEEQKLVPADLAAEDQFGCSVAIFGTEIFVGASFDDDDGSGSGSVYVFRFDGVDWVEVQKLNASDAAPIDKFGVSVAIDGDVAVIGSKFDDDMASNSGTAYVFRKVAGQWVEEQKLVPADGALEDRAGIWVGIAGDTAMVGASNDDDGGGNSGSVYIFRFDGVSWVEEQKLIGEAAGDSFGNEFSLDGDVVLVGARFNDSGSSNGGAAYVYRRSGNQWLFEQKLVASDSSFDQRFGNAVDLSGDQAVIGARFDSESGSRSGGAFIFRLGASGWIEEYKLRTTAPMGIDLLGQAVALSGDLAIVGASQDDDGGLNSGSACFYSGISEPGPASGTVHMAFGDPMDVLFVNGEAGGGDRHVEVGIGEEIEIQLQSPPSFVGAPARYCLWIWTGGFENCVELGGRGETIGATVNPTPLHVGVAPQAFRCFGGAGLPDALCAGVQELAGPNRTPWTLRRPAGLGFAAGFAMQALVEDGGAGNGTGFSLSNAVGLVVE